ncbi:MAG: ABC transporter ATP-binding protein [Planctomycetota bacterium]
MIELRGIGKEYAQASATVRALVDVDLDVDAGEALAVLGPSGSGKSTLLHLLGLLETPTRGTYALGGRAVSGLAPDELARVRNREVGFVFQRFHLVPRLDAVENVALPMRFGSVGRRDRRRRALELLDEVGLAERATHRPAELSGGQQQRVAIARALALRPRLLLADEPTGALDQSVGSEILELLLGLNRGGTTLVVVTHDEGLAARLPRQVRMLDGRVERDDRRVQSSPQA